MSPIYTSPQNDKCICPTAFFPSPFGCLINISVLSCSNPNFWYLYLPLTKVCCFYSLPLIKTILSFQLLRQKKKKLVIFTSDFLLSLPTLNLSIYLLAVFSKYVQRLTTSDVYRYSQDHLGPYHCQFSNSLPFLTLPLMWLSRYSKLKLDFSIEPHMIGTTHCLLTTSPITFSLHYCSPVILASMLSRSSTLFCRVFVLAVLCAYNMFFHRYPRAF